MAFPPSKKGSVLIVGAGAFGLATALELSQSGYKDITVLERDSEIPSKFSAAFDINKIVRAEYEDPFYIDLSIKAIKSWQTPFYSPHYHHVGYLHTVSGNATEDARSQLSRSLGSISNHPSFTDSIVPIKSGEDVKKLIWQYRQGSFNKWSGYLNRNAGYAHSSNAMRAVFEKCAQNGVKFVTDPKDGYVIKLLFSSGTDRKCIGAQALSGRRYNSSTVILALGANVSCLLPDLGIQVEARSWSVAHVRLTENEASRLKGIPVTYARDLGFFFEPDPVTKLLKLCPMGAGYTNYSSQKISLPPPQLESSAFIPAADEAKVRRLLQETLPHLAQRPLIKTKLCWFADTKDSDYIIDYVPNTGSSLVVLSGDSGHGFKMFPLFGGWVRELLESGEKQQPILKWRWKNTQAVIDSSHKISWRIGTSRDFQSVRPTKL